MSAASDLSAALNAANYTGAAAAMASMSSATQVQTAAVAENLFLSEGYH